MKNHKKTIISIAVVLFLAGTYVGVRYYIGRTVKKQVDREIRRMSSFADIRYKTVHVDLFGKEIRLKSVRLSPKYIEDLILIDELILFQPGKKSDTTESIHVRLNGIRMDPAQQDGMLKPFIKDLGYADIRANLECNGSYDRKSRILELTRLQVGAGRMAEAALRLRLENIDLDQMESGPSNAIVLLTMLSGVSIAGAELTYKDGSLLKKVIESEARRSGQSVDTYIQMLSGRIAQVFQNPSDPATRKILETLHGFLLTPDSITIRVRPERPVSVMRLIWARKPDKILKMLGIEVNT